MSPRFEDQYIRRVQLGGGHIPDETFEAIIGAETPVHTRTGRRCIGRIVAAHVTADGESVLLYIDAPDHAQAA